MFSEKNELKILHAQFEKNILFKDLLKKILPLITILIK